MTFTKASAYYILLNSKTQTRRVWKRRAVKEGGVYWAQTHRYKAESRFARIRVTSIKEWDGKQISLEDARKEGFDSVAEFWEGYLSLNEKSLEDPTRKQYIIDFEVVETLKRAIEFLSEQLTQGE